MAFTRKRKYAAKRRPKRRAARSSFSGSLVSAIKGYALTKLKQKLGLNTESKFVDVAGTTTATATLTSRIAAPTIAQGLTVGTRTGASLRVTKVETRISIVAALAATLPTNVRIIQARNTRTGQSVPADILETSTDFSSPINNECAANGIQILKDVVVPIGTATGGDGCAYLQWTHSALSDHMLWPDADTTGTPAACIKGCITTLWMLDNVTTAPVFTAKSRYWFVDN